jgi:hypothetical protein
MTVLAKMVAADMEAVAYDRMAAYPTKLLRDRPGFILHVAYPAPSGFYIEEIWENQPLFEAWLEENVRPNVPAIQTEVIQLHDVVLPAPN